MQYDPDLIITIENRPMVIEHLLGEGHSAPSLAIMDNVQLANLYHSEKPGNDVQRATSDAVLQTLATMSSITRDVITAIAHNEAKAIIDALAPRRIEVVSPLGGLITLPGSVHYRTEMVIRIASLAHAILLVGPAGCGKTTIGEHTAIALALAFYITSTINDTHELLGFVDGYGRYHDTPFRNAYEKGGVWVADEIDAWDAAALLAANSALANGYCNFPDAALPVARHPNFRMIATANTFGTGADRIYVGRNELDAASLDRFATIDVNYDLDLERMFAGTQTRWLDHVWAIRKAVADKKIRHVVSSRAIGMGAVALSAGLAWDDVNEIYLFKGMSDRDREKIK